MKKMDIIVTIVAVFIAMVMMSCSENSSHLDVEDLPTAPAEPTFYWPNESGSMDVYDDNGNGVKADILHSDPLVDPVGRSVRRDTNNLKVRRGGGWYFAQKFSRSAYRGGHNYEAEKNYLGIRLVAPVAADWK